MLKTLQFYLDRERYRRKRGVPFFFFLAEHNTMSTRIGGVGAWSMAGGRRRTKIEIWCMLRIVMCFILILFISLQGVSQMSDERNEG